MKQQFVFSFDENFVAGGQNNDNNNVSNKKNIHDNNVNDNNNSDINSTDKNSINDNDDNNINETIISNNNVNDDDINNNSINVNDDDSDEVFLTSEKLEIYKIRNAFLKNSKKFRNFSLSNYFESDFRKVSTPKFEKLQENDDSRSAVDRKQIVSSKFRQQRESMKTDRHKRSVKKAVYLPTRKPYRKQFSNVELLVNCVMCLFCWCT